MSVMRIKMTSDGLTEENIGKLSPDFEHRFSLIANNVRMLKDSREIARDELRLLMMKRGFSRGDLAKISLVNPSTVTRWFDGESIIPFSVFYLLDKREPEIIFEYSFFTSKLTITYTSPFKTKGEIDCSRAPHVAALISAVWRESGIKVVLLSTLFSYLIECGIKENDILPFINTEAKTVNIRKKDFSNISLERFCRLMIGVDKYWKNRSGGKDELYKRRMRGNLLDYLECFASSFRLRDGGDDEGGNGESPSGVNQPNEGTGEGEGDSI